MNQLSLLDDERPEDRAVRLTPEAFLPGFGDWLKENRHIWLAFQREADKVRARGRPHYSARTIIHFLRHESTLREVDGEWKINNNVSPDLARLYMLLWPTAWGFFELRGERKP